MSTLFIFHPDGSFSQRESKEHAFDVAREINQGLWEKHLPYSLADDQAWKAIQVDQRVLIFNPIPGEVLDVPRLNARELQALQLLVAGYSIAQIAWSMHIQVRTVSAHLARLRQKFRALTTFELIALAVKSGLVTPQYHDY
ncbi:MAG TPA: helix-turn-helix transcriptional regulator [Anaerolineaceae bacterium]|nr:helix-turn-helix transcriptional regulator [Anaerolineaceae bacterium]